MTHYTISEEIPYYDENNKVEFEYWISNKTWMVLMCCVCNNISIATEYKDRNLVQLQESFISIIYPHKSCFHIICKKNI